MNNIASLIKSADTTIVDVRSPAEYSGGHVADSINIPLNEVPQRIAEFKNMKQVVLCCASGGRSGQATAFLSQQGIICANGGAWLEVNLYKNN